MESDSISFAVTGHTDVDFTGGHVETGEYEVFVDVHNSSGGLIDSFSEVRTLQSGIVHEFEFPPNPAWIGGSYNVNINNRLRANDVDFFTFTGLSPGASFAARTLNTEPSSVDTFLGWFSDAGTLLESDDDDGGGLLSLIEGVVPTNGELTFAVTGFGDSVLVSGEPLFEGLHSEAGGYELRVTIPVPGDYNGNGLVDAADYTLWRDNLGTDFDLNGNGDETGGSANVVDQADYALWKAHFGETVGTGAGARIAAHSASAVPEPSTALLAALCGVILSARCRISRNVC